MKPRHLLPVLLSLAAAPLVLAQGNPPVLPIGSPIPEFSLPGIDGETHTLDTYADAKILCILFTSNHCPDSVGASKRIQQLHLDYQDRGVVLVAVNPNNPAALRSDELGYSPYNDSFEEQAPFARDNGWTFPYLYDGETQSFARACGTQSTPHIFVFDEERKLRYTGRMDDGGRNPGPVDKSYIRDALDALLDGREVEEPVTRSFGCSTKWLDKAPSVLADNENWENREVTMAELDASHAATLRANGTNKLRLVYFWSTSCGPCVAKFPDYVETSRRFQNRNFELITISMDPPDEGETVSKFLSSRHAAMADRTANSVREEGRTTNNYHWTGGNPDQVAEAIDPEWTGALPHSALISKEGEVLWSHSGEMDPTELRRKILEFID